MSGNYPPGVSGNEPQIAGYDEAVMTMTCSEVGLCLYPKTLVDDLLDEVSQVFTVPRTVRSEGQRGWRPENDAERLVRAQNRLLKVREELDTAVRYDEDAMCGFSGQVDVQINRTVVTWTCPWCGAEHEDDLAEEDR